MKHASLALALAALAALGAPSLAHGSIEQSKGSKKGAAAEVVPWSGTYEDALQRAFDRNVPLVLFAIVEAEDEAPHEDVAKFRDEIFTSPEFAALGERMVVAVGANRAHELKTIEVETEGGAKTKKQICSVYRTEGCAAHQKLFDSIYAEHNVEGELRSPAAIVIAPDRKIAAKWADGQAPAWTEILAKTAEHAGKFGDPLSEAQWSDLRGLLVRGKAEIERAQWGAANATWSKVLAITSKSRYADDARANLKLALEGLTRARDEARAKIAAGSVVEGYAKLLDLLSQCAGTSLEKELTREIAALEKDKATKDAIAEYKREREADALWEEARKLAADGEPKKAEAKIRVLLRKHGETAAGKRAREAHPKLAAEEDAKKG
jgi:hypothetical protein